MSDYDLLIKKLDRFIRKYYLNQLIKGIIFFVSLFGLSFLLSSLLEYFGHTGRGFRTVLFFSLLSMHLVTLYAWVLTPLLKLNSFGKLISHSQAAKIIGDHFQEVGDKLLNTLQLKAENTGSRELIEASVSQKLEELKPVPFSMAIDLKGNRKYLKYALIPLVILSLLLIQFPDVILESSARIISYNKEFLPEAPFSFELENEELKTLMHEDFLLELEVEGKVLPQTVYVVVDGNQFRMNRKDGNHFTYLMKNLSEDRDFKFYAAGFNSAAYTLSVLPKPFLKAFKVVLDYPDYTGRKDEELQNIGDLSIPEGTVVRWDFNTENSDELIFRYNGQLLEGEQYDEAKFRVTKQIQESGQYFVQSTNEYVKKNDSMGYTVEVMEDEYPLINVEMNRDSASLKTYFFSGELSDDYGISGLSFYYRFTNSADQAKVDKGFVRKGIGVSSRSIQSFFHYWDLNEIGYDAGDELEFYFELWDNDQINGAKSSRSQKFRINAPTKREIENKVAETSSKIKDDIENTIKEAAKVQQELEDVRNRLMNKDKPDWQDKQAVKKLLERQRSLQQQIEKLNEQYKEMLKEQDEFSKMDERIREKHEKLMELFDQLMDEEMKKLFDELQKMLEENMDGMDEKLDEMKFDNEELEKELDATLEHFKQLELEQKMQESIDKLDELAKKQEELAKETEKEGGDQEELSKKQEELNKEFEEVREDIDEIEKKNEELDRPHEMEDTDSEEESIEQDMKEGKENIDQGKKNKATQKQKEAAEKMRELQKRMEAAKKNMEQKSLSLDYEALRQIMENLIYLSFEQEKLINELNDIHGYNPKFIDLAQRQMKLKGDARLIEDSLVALSKRVMQISGFINEEVGKMNYNLEKTVTQLSERNIPQSRKYQQYVMTHVNNLAVMLSEVMDQMQQDMSQQMKGQQNCQKPNGKPQKGSKPDMKKQLGNMRQLQEQLNNQMKEMKKRMDRGQRPMSKELAKIAAQQEALRQQLQQLNEMKEQGGDKPSKELKEIQEMMDETEKDIVNEDISKETLKRQKDILTRLLESEKAEREREFSEERESKTGDQVVDPSKKAFEEYKRARLKEIELLNTVPPQLNGYYKKKVKEYFEQR